MTGEELLDHWPFLVHYAHKRLPHLDVAVAEDLASHAIERALTHYREAGLHQGLRRWLLTTVRNAAIDVQRRKSYGEVPLLFADVLHGRCDAGSDRHLDWLDVRAALDMVKPRYRQNLDRYEAGYTHQEIAAQDGRSYRAQKLVRSRAVKALRTVLLAEVAS